MHFPREKYKHNLKLFIKEAPPDPIDSMFIIHHCNIISLNHDELNEKSYSVES